MISTLVLAGVVVGFAAAQIPNLKSGSKNSQTSTVQQQPQAPKAPEPVPGPEPLSADQIAKLPDDDPVFGQTNAPITMVEFSDFQCPYCEKFFESILPLIEENYIKTGKVKLVYRDFPLDKHRQALPAAEAANCANEQGKFKEMHDMLFKKQQEWAENEKAADVFKEYARTLGLKTKQFNECFDTHKYQLEAKKDFIDGAAAGVDGTPGFFVNGTAIPGALPYDRFFQPIFEAILAGKKWEIIYKLDSYGDPYPADLKIH